MNIPVKSFEDVQIEIDRQWGWDMDMDFGEEYGGKDYKDIVSKEQVKTPLDKAKTNKEYVICFDTRNINKKNKTNLHVLLNEMNIPFTQQSEAIYLNLGKKNE